MSTMRLGGLASNMDTDSMVANMLKAQRMKQDKLKASKTKLGWQQDQWKELQTKLYKLYTDFASPMRMSDAYNTKKVTSSNNDKVSVTIPPGVTNVSEGTHEITSAHTASSQYVTGGKIGLDKNGNKVTASTKLTDLGMVEGAVFTINNGGKESSFQVRADSTIEEYTYALKNAGLVANFDEGQGRMFIYSKASGADNKFSITSTQMSGGLVTARNDLDEFLKYKDLSSTSRSDINNAYMTLKPGSSASETDKQKMRDTLHTIAKENAEAKQMSDATQTVKDGYAAEIKMGGIYEDDYLKIKAEVEKGLGDTATADDIKKAIEKGVAAKAAEYTATEAGQAKVKDQYDNVIGGGITNVLDGVKATLDTKISTFESAAPDIGSASASLNALGLAETDGSDQASSPIGMVVKAAKNSQIIYNGAPLEGSSNTFTLNGITIEIKGDITEAVSIGVTKDTQAVYDKIKKFIGGYNDILKEMNDLYYASSSKGYEPLTDEEQEAMSDKQIEQWEKKIKDSILRRDDNLATLTNGMKNAMMSSVEVNGKRYSLSSFGIATSDTDYTEKGLLHIWGDKTDATYEAKTDKLMEALESDPDLVMQVFTGIAGNLHKEMMDKMKGTEMRTAMKFYNDKSMADKMRKYDKDIAAWDKKLATMETRYYKQFSDMEVALSKLNSQQNSLAGMLG